MLRPNANYTGRDAPPTELPAGPCKKCGGTGRQTGVVLNGQRLRWERYRRGIGAAWIADKLGLSVQYVLMIEGGQRRLTKELWDRYMSALEEVSKRKGQQR